MNWTVAVCVTTTCPAPGRIVAVTVLVCAAAEATPPVVTPAASVVDTGCVTVLAEPVVAMTTV
jgi:hypothetical protein